MSNNTSATGGYLTPTDKALPGNVTLEQFLHGVIYGITEIDKKMIRPRYQTEPGKQPKEPETNWCSFSFTEEKPDANAFVKQGANESELSRHVELQLYLSFYGSNGFKNAGIFRDGLQLAQNREVLIRGGIGFKSAGQALYVPELISNRWFPRTDLTIVFRREVIRTYKVLSILSASGNIIADNETDNGLTTSFNVEE